MSDMKYHNEDIAACTNDKCPQKDTCLRWQVGTNNDTYQTYLDGTMCEGEFYVESKSNNYGHIRKEIQRGSSTSGGNH